MTRFEATIHYYDNPTGQTGTTETIIIEFYAHNFNSAMLIASSKTFSMFNNTNKRVYQIDLAVYASGT